MKFILFTIISVILLVPSIYGQAELAEYRQAKQLVSKGNYDQAMHLLKPYMDFENYGEVANYATFYFAKAAHESGQYKLSENTLQQILQKTQWRHQDDVKYLSVLNNFNLQNISTALNTKIGRAHV